MPESFIPQGQDLVFVMVPFKQIFIVVLVLGSDNTYGLFRSCKTFCQLVMFRTELSKTALQGKVFIQTVCYERLFRQEAPAGTVKQMLCFKRLPARIEVKDKVTCQ